MSDEIIVGHDEENDLTLTLTPPVLSRMNPDTKMRHLGYDVNPEMCDHTRKIFGASRKWICKDCGTILS